MLVIFLFILAVLSLHTLYVLLKSGLNHIHKGNFFGAGAAHGFKNAVEPAFRLPADINKQVALLYLRDIGQGGLKAVHLAAGRGKHNNLRLVPADCPRKIVLRENCSYNTQLIALFTLAFTPAKQRGAKA